MRALSEDRCEAVMVTAGALAGCAPALLRLAIWQQEFACILGQAHHDNAQGPRGKKEEVDKAKVLGRNRRTNLQLQVKFRFSRGAEPLQQVRGTQAD